jgi:hypothetical protein
MYLCMSMCIYVLFVYDLPPLLLCAVAFMSSKTASSCSSPNACKIILIQTVLTSAEQYSGHVKKHVSNIYFDENNMNERA